MMTLSASSEDEISEWIYKVCQSVAETVRVDGVYYGSGFGQTKMATVIGRK